MNLTESLAFDTEAARQVVEKHGDDFRAGDACDAALTAYEIIDLLKVEITRLHALEAALAKPSSAEGVKPKSKIITAAMVSALRDKTDSPMMFCKKALIECNGDAVAAEAWLLTRIGNRI